MKRFLKHLRGLRVSYKINRTQMLMSMGIPILFGLFSGILISKRIYEPDKKALDSKFEEVYETLKESSEYIYNLSDTLPLTLNLKISVQSVEIYGAKRRKAW